MTLIWGGLSLGAVYALVAVGYNIVFLSSKTMNFAQAQLMMVGAFVAYQGYVWGAPAIVVLVMCALVVTAAAAIEYVAAIRFVKDQHNILVTTLGASILLDGLVQKIWGGAPRNVEFFAGDSAFQLLGGRLYPVELALMVTVVVVVVGLAAFAGRTMHGLALMGMAEDREAAMLRGVNVRRAAFLAFAGAGTLAGVSALVVGPKTFAVSTLGASLALKGFVVLALVGFGSLYGPLLGGVVVGVVEALAARYLGAEYVNLSVFLILLAVLLVKPTGLFVRSTERVV